MTRLKKIIGIAGVCLGLLNTSYAANFYIAPTLVYESINANGIRYEDINPRLALGYGDFYSESIYISGELFASPATINVNNATDANASLKTNYNYGIGLLPGYYLDDVLMAFGRLGLICTNFSNLDKLATGFQAGLGFQWMVTQVWSVRGEYDYTMYGTQPRVGDANSNQFGLGLVYYFG